MDHILFWNARGARGKNFKSDIVDNTNMNKLSVLIICEPRVQSKSHLDDLFKLDFNKAEIIEAFGFSGGICLLWNSNVITIEPLLSITQAITMKVVNRGYSLLFMLALIAILEIRCGIIWIFYLLVMLCPGFLLGILMSFSLSLKRKEVLLVVVLLVSKGGWIKML